MTKLADRDALINEVFEFLTDYRDCHPECKEWLDFDLYGYRVNTKVFISSYNGETVRCNPHHDGRMIIINFYEPDAKDTDDYLKCYAEIIIDKVIELANADDFELFTEASV